MTRPNFKKHTGPSPLTSHVERVVRFEEIDPLGIMWHGRYASFFEDARGHLGNKLGIGYMDFYKNGILVPIKHFYIDYHLPLKFKDNVIIEAMLHWSEAARLNIEYTIKNSNGKRTTSGYTVQVMLNLDNELFLIPPEFYKQFCDQWKAGNFL